MSGTTAGTTAANPFLLPNDWILSVPIEALTSAGVVEALPSGDTPTVTSANTAALNATVGAAADGSPVMNLNALVDGSVTNTALQVTLADSAGLSPESLWFQIVSDTTPTNLEALLTGATHTTQAVPPPG